MQTTSMSRSLVAAGLACGLLVNAGCSGPHEDVRVTLCKNLTAALLPDAGSVEWTGNENAFYRPEYAVTGLTFEALENGGDRISKRSACHYAYTALDDTAITLADPLSAYATLPFKMTFDGRQLTDAELLTLVNAEQKRLGRKAVETLKQGASDMVDKVRSGIGQ